MERSNDVVRTAKEVVSTGITADRPPSPYFPIKTAIQIEDAAQIRRNFQTFCVSTFFHNQFASCHF